MVSSPISTIISVGIPTDGEPAIERCGAFTRLRNQLIGLGFHWQRSITTELPGEVVPNDDPVYRLINRLPVETYLECVVGSEMNPEAPVEFLKAHAVISRGWAMGKVTGSHPTDSKGKMNSETEIINWEDTCDHNGFDVCSDDHCQRYQGLQRMDPRISDAIHSTAGICLVDPEGKLVDTRFSKCCGGRTEIFSTCWQSGEANCLQSISDPWCNLSDLSMDKREKLLKSILKDYDLTNGGGYEWESSISAEEVRHNLKVKFGRDIGKILNLEIVSRGSSGRVKSMRIHGENATLDVGKELMVRRLLAPTHLYSSRIEISKDKVKEDLFRISGRGWGHGVGLCQIGAARMAMDGATYEEILYFYYPGSRLAGV